MIDAVRPGDKVVPRPARRGDYEQEFTNMDSVMESWERSEVKDG